ncbi:MAG: hypothetical protein HYY79_02140 [Betaproteobacteria bacterium]|nr:hypothetical protein [Betaproteobacteria bacterium]
MTMSEEYLYGGRLAEARPAAGVKGVPIRPLDEAGKRRLRAELEGMGIFETEPHGW